MKALIVLILYLAVVYGLGMAFHITLNSIKKAWQDFGGSHVVFCLEGRSWRKGDCVSGVW